MSSHITVFGIVTLFLGIAAQKYKSRLNHKLMFRFVVESRSPHPTDFTVKSFEIVPMATQKYTMT